MIFWYARYFEYCIYFLKFCFYFLNLRKESLSLIGQLSTSTIIFMYTCLNVSPGEGLEIREYSFIGSFLELSYACLGAPWVQIWPRICKERGQGGRQAFCHHCRRPRGCSRHRCSACTCWGPSSQHNVRASRTSDMPGTSALSSHPHPHVTAQVSFSMLPPYTAREEGSRVSVGRHLPSRSHLCLDRVHCCRLDSDRRTRHRKQPPAHLTVSTSSCTWRRRL